MFENLVWHFFFHSRAIQTIKTSYFHHSIITNPPPPNSSLLCLKSIVHMHRYMSSNHQCSIFFNFMRTSNVGQVIAKHTFAGFNFIKSSSPPSIHHPSSIFIKSTTHFSFGISHTDEKRFSFMSAGVCEIGIQ